MVSTNPEPRRPQPLRCPMSAAKRAPGGCAPVPVDLREALVGRQPRHSMPGRTFTPRTQEFIMLGEDATQQKTRKRPHSTDPGGRAAGRSAATHAAGRGLQHAPGPRSSGPMIRQSSREPRFRLGPPRLGRGAGGTQCQQPDQSLASSIRSIAESSSSSGRRTTRFVILSGTELAGEKDRLHRRSVSRSSLYPGVIAISAASPGPAASRPLGELALAQACGSSSARVDRPVGSPENSSSRSPPAGC